MLTFFVSGIEMLLTSQKLVHKDNSRAPVRWSSYGSRGSPSSGDRSSSSPRCRPGCVWTQWWRTARRSYRGHCKPLRHPTSRGDKRQLHRQATHPKWEWRMRGGGWMKAEKKDGKRKEGMCRFKVWGEEEQVKKRMQSIGWGNEIKKGDRMTGKVREGGGRKKEEQKNREGDGMKEIKNTGTVWSDAADMMNGARRWKVERKNMQGGTKRG